MDAQYLEDRIAWAGNLVARRIGTQADAFRPDGPDHPMAPRNRYLRLHAAFSTTPASFTQTGGFGTAICYGHFDLAYTRPGDYLVQGSRTYFIAAQERLQPVLCVRTNRTLTIRRTAAPSSVGSNVYGGLTPEGTVPVLQGWPASVLGMATSGVPQTGLPTDISMPQWTVLLPSTGKVKISSTDLVSDEDGMRGTVVVAESTHLGWRMIVRQASA
jgi:hypothetical protein